FGDTLNKNPAREESDEKHICPLSLDIIGRALKLWSAPDDIILDPFGGIMSTGYKALQMGRRFVGIELKESYWKVGAHNCKTAAEQQEQITLFGGEAI
ncbi:MAG TPA: hypothetical protein DDZ66_02300, partial [Firmicutes bacterium]|nr:hypothetical protein [Bacillota bacterium]